MVHKPEKDEIDSAIAAWWGLFYINDFSDRGRTKRINMQADAPFRMVARDFEQYRLRNSRGGMTPLSLFADIK